MKSSDKINRATDIVNEFMKPVHKFVVSRINNYHDAEDLVQEICIKIFKSLCIRDDIISVEKYVWTIAHNSLANFYKSKGRSTQYMGIGISEVEYMLSENSNPEIDYIYAETIDKLHNEIAYLSKLQREIVVLHYYHGIKQSDIAERIGIPLGTVKWYLSEAKTELKKGMETMRTNELKFNPIKFNLISVSGAETRDTYNYLQNNLLAQNISYCVYREALTVNEIADNLNVSPVYIENEVELLERHGLLIKNSDKYLTNFIIDEPNQEEYDLLAEMYENAAKLVANDLYDALIDNEILDNENLYFPNGDKNFLMWTLIPYILANSGDGFEDKIPFDEVATPRIDGGTNIVEAIIDGKSCVPKHIELMQHWSGPMWNGNDNTILWQCNHKWSGRDFTQEYAKNVINDLSLIEEYLSGKELSKNDYAYLVSKGYLTGKDGDFKPAVVVIKTKAYKDKLLSIGNAIKEKHNDSMKNYKDKYINLVLSNTPKRLRKVKEYGLQYIYYADGWFLLYSILELLENGKLTPVADNRQKSMTTLIIPNSISPDRVNRFLI